MPVIENTTRNSSDVSVYPGEKGWAIGNDHYTKTVPPPERVRKIWPPIVTSNILDLIGNTPLMQLKGERIFAKAEFLNPGGSIREMQVAKGASEISERYLASSI